LEASHGLISKAFTTSNGLDRAAMDEQPTVSFELTTQGKEFVKHLAPVIYWANDILPTVKENRMKYEEKTQSN